MNTEVIQVPPTVSHQYLVAGKNGFLLIDTGLSNNYTHLTKYLRTQKIDLASLEMAVITHADGDHFGCLAALQQSSPSLVGVASKIEAEAIRKGESSRPMKSHGARQVFTSLVAPLFLSKPARIDRILAEGDTLPFLGELEVIDSRGHTPGHISLWSASTRTLFAGDSIKIKLNALLPSSGANPWDEALAIQSFEKQIALKPDRIYAGHGVWLRE